MSVMLTVLRNQESLGFPSSQIKIEFKPPKYTGQLNNRFRTLPPGNSYIQKRKISKNQTTKKTKIAYMYY